MHRPEYEFESSINSRRAERKFRRVSWSAAPLAFLAMLVNGCDTKSAPMTKAPAPQVTVAKVQCKPVVEAD